MSSNRNIKFGLESFRSLEKPPLNKPMIPCKFKKRSLDMLWNEKSQEMGPGKYNPKYSLITKSSPRTKIIFKHQIQKDQIYKLNRFMNNIMLNGSLNLGEMDLLKIKSEDVQPMTHLNSIEQRIRKNARKGVNASFASTTNRISYKSDVPGPGSYDVKHDHQFRKNKFDSFGTTAERSIEFNRSINLPFTDPSYLSNPPVGYYKVGQKCIFKRSDVKSSSPIKRSIQTKEYGIF
jgi:hypothetical protein